MNEKPVLVAREGQLVGQRWTIDTDEFIIGRGHECHIVLPERQVSRHHVKIILENSSNLQWDLDGQRLGMAADGPVRGPARGR